MSNPTALKRSRRKRVVRLDLALADMCAAMDRLNRETGGNFRFTLTWEPVPKKPAPEKRPSRNSGVSA